MKLICGVISIIIQNNILSTNKICVIYFLPENVHFFLFSGGSTALRPPACAPMYVCIYVCMHVYIYIYIYIHTHVYVYIYIYKIVLKTHLFSKIFRFLYKRIVSLIKI